ncbi:MAG TPA: heme-copper oxidase subunit III [bacterium]|jgi:cytochrome c oxidase subunit 3|nr:heme-copper oxidase subunit III [bacterium]
MASRVKAADKTKEQRKIEPAMLGILLFIVVEVMFFAGLISSFLVFRLSPVQWPPAGQPRLPIEVTAVNTVVLLLSGFVFYKASKVLGEGKKGLYLSLLSLTAFLGILFLATQGYEWVHLVKYGLSASSNVYGGFFYALVGMHGFHVFGGVLALLWVLVRSLMGAYSAKQHLGVDLCRTYWFFVVGLWPILFGLIYF